MNTAQLAYPEPAPAPRRQALSLSIFADRPHLRASLREDAEAAGCNVRQAGDLDRLLEPGPRALGDVVLVDCPRSDGRVLAALSRLDEQAAEGKVHPIVSTTIEALDAVFACMNRSEPQLLVDPSRAERILALGAALADRAEPHLRERAEEDRLLLLRLCEQVGKIAQRLERLAPVQPADAPRHDEDPSLRFEAPRRLFNANDAGTALQAVPGAAPPLPDPRLVRRMIRERQSRTRFFDRGLFADPAWDMLLDLTAALAERVRVSVTSLCIASGVPPTTALRWIGQMTEAGLFQRSDDDTDRRRAFITLTPKARQAMARYFHHIQSQNTQNQTAAPLMPNLPTGER